MSETMTKPKSKFSAPLDPTKQALAVKAIRETLATLGVDDDETLLLDTIEGETEFYEVTDAILERIHDDQAMVAAVDAQVDVLKVRKDRFKKRVETYKALIEQAFLVADMPKVERPLGTLYLANRGAKVIIETESDIPARYWKPADPVLDGKQLSDDLKAMKEAIGAIIGGAGEARDAAIAALCQRFLDDEQAAQLREHLAWLDDAQTEADFKAAEAALRHKFGGLPGASLSEPARTLSIRVA